MKKQMWKPILMFGVMIIVMFGLMFVFSLLFSGTNPMAMMLTSGYSVGPGMWGVMIVPVIGIILMLVMMFFAFRWMMGNRSPMRNMMGGTQQEKSKTDLASLTTLSYQIPAVNCAHCKMKIEEELGKLPGVDSVNVDVETQRATITLVRPPTKSEIGEVLTNIGYPPA